MLGILMLFWAWNSLYLSKKSFFFPKPYTVNPKPHATWSRCTAAFSAVYMTFGGEMTANVVLLRNSLKNAAERPICSSLPIMVWQRPESPNSFDCLCLSNECLYNMVLGSCSALPRSSERLLPRFWICAICSSWEL